MRFIKTLVLLCALAAVHNTATAQRYLTPQFSTVSKSALTPYGFNYTVLPVLFNPAARTTRQPLVMQVYTPDGDTETKRPLIIYLHTGNFFPFPQNNSCGGALNDSSNVEFATRLAKMGYVVAVADYRLGWAPTATTETTRRFTLINAAYRGLQDVSTCVRFFRKNVAEQGNTYKIDPEKIVVWGQGTGGYLSLASAYLNEFKDIYNTSDPNKFVIINPQLPGGKYNMVQEAVNGDIYATTGPTTVDVLLNVVSGGLFKTGDTLCIPNHVGYASNFQLCVNMGGALGDSTWLDKGDVPLISYHVPSDFFAPCETNVLNVPSINGPQPVVEVTGSCGLHPYVEQYGNNDVFKKILPTADKYGAIAKARSGGANGFFPLIGTPNNTSSPWEWTNLSGVPAPLSTAGCTNFDGAVARAYIDTIITYFAPRACVALGLNCPGVTSGTNDLLTDAYLQVVPNPAQSVMTFQADADHLIQSVELFDISGRAVRSVFNINQPNFEMQRGNMVSGMYVAKIRFRDGIVARRVVFE